jgi:2-polyprenyl-6-methoxyphenol hydroxylase-like FAD-dependent oxidoreductase
MLCIFLHAYNDINWASRYGINSRMMHTLKSGNIFFGGDSAHIHSPAGGQGMNTGIQDMINLAWKLAMVIKVTLSLNYWKPTSKNASRLLQVY